MRKIKSKNDSDGSRRRGAVAIADGDERGLVLRLLLHSPKDLAAAMFASAAVIAIVSNAMFMQAGRHPSPMFGAAVSLSSAPETASPLPRPRPIDALARPERPEMRVAEPKAADLRSVEIHPAEPRKSDPLANLVRTTAPPAAPVPLAPPVAPAAAANHVPRPPAPIPSAARDSLGEMIVSSRRVASVQRALTEYGYGQLKPTGTVGSDTQAAIQRFERARKIPVTGQMSDRLVRELAAMTGRPID